MTLWDWVNGHQNLTAGILAFAGVIIASIFGFTGVILTLRHNAQQARDQRQEERRHECRSLRVALIEELKINRAAVINNTEMTKTGAGKLSEAGGYYIPTDLMDDGYRAFIDRIGLLSQPEVRKVIFAYLSLRTYKAKLFLVGVPPHTGDRHVQVPVENAPMLIGLLESLISPLDEAIEIMEQAHVAEG